MIATPPMVGVPRLTRWPAGPSSRISCPKPRSRKYRTIARGEQDREQQRGDGGEQDRFHSRPVLPRAFARVNGRRRGVPERDGDSFEACGSGCLHQYHVSGPKLVAAAVSMRSIRVGDPRRLTIPGAFQSGAVGDRPGGRTPTAISRDVQSHGEAADRVVLGPRHPRPARPSRRARRPRAPPGPADARPAPAARPASTPDWRCRRR